MSRHQRGHIFERHGAFHVRFYQMEMRDGIVTRVQKSHKLCDKGGVFKTRTSTAVREKCEDHMRTVNAAVVVAQDVTVADFYEKTYLPYIEKVVPLTGEPRFKPSSVRSIKQIWRQHLKKHFGKVTLREYEAMLGTRFLQSLTGTQSKNTIKHVRAAASAIFKRAQGEQHIRMNPWRDVIMPDDAIDGKPTEHYTIEEAEDIISVLVDHVDCQLVMALSCFLALRPNEIAALKWEDFDTEWLHIRRGVVRGIVGTPKTLESVASLPLIDQVVVPLELWRKKCGKPTEGWVFESKKGTPVDLHNLTARVIVPHVEGKRECVRCENVPDKTKLKWRSLYSGRRGAITNAIEKSNGNFAVGQALARHKSGKTTLDVYKKAITPEAFKAGMKMLEATSKRDQG